jgi:hypothetical protein
MVDTKQGMMLRRGLELARSPFQTEPADLTQLDTKRITDLQKLESQKRPPDRTSPINKEHFSRPQLRPDFFVLEKKSGNSVCFHEILQTAP